MGSRIADLEAELVEVRLNGDELAVNLLDSGDYTTRQVAEAYGVSQPRIVQIHNRARKLPEYGPRRAAESETDPFGRALFQEPSTIRVAGDLL